MHAMVNQLRQEKQNHDESVENLTLKQLREKVRTTKLHLKRVEAYSSIKFILI